MAYTSTNYKTKKALIDDFKLGRFITVFQPGPFGPDVKDGVVYLEGPHYPEAHKWYVQGEAKDGVLIAIKGVKHRHSVRTTSGNL